MPLNLGKILKLSFNYYRPDPKRGKAKGRDPSLLNFSNACFEKHHLANLKSITWPTTIFPLWGFSPIAGSGFSIVHQENVCFALTGQGSG